MGAIYLVRHGQASFGTSNYDRLSELGHRQARQLGHYWRSKGLRIDHWVTGSLERQIHTARNALETLEADYPVARDTRFNEFEHERVTARILPELATTDAFVQDYLAGRMDRRAGFQTVFEKVVDAWTARDDWGDELDSWGTFVTRVNDGLNALISATEGGSNVAVVTSGGTITAILARLLNLTPANAFMMNWSIANASITKLKFSHSSGRRSLAYFNQYNYLQTGADRSLITMR
jgi:broad specificity phosphatase PhoE